MTTLNLLFPVLLRCTDRTRRDREGWVPDLKESRWLEQGLLVSTLFHIVEGSLLSGVNMISHFLTIDQEKVSFRPV